MQGNPEKSSRASYKWHSLLLFPISVLSMQNRIPLRNHHFTVEIVCVNPNYVIFFSACTYLPIYFYIKRISTLFLNIFRPLVEESNVFLPRLWRCGEIGESTGGDSSSRPIFESTHTASSPPSVLVSKRNIRFHRGGGGCAGGLSTERGSAPSLP